MCLLIDNSAGADLPMETIKKAARMNPDGYGRLCLMTGRIQRTMDMGQAIKLAMRPGPAIHHFRWATVGGKTLQNAHPFPVDKGWYLFQNGTIEGFVDNGKTDTANLAELLRHIPHESRAAALSRFDQRYVLASAKTHEVIRTGAGWVQHGGVWYSNAYCCSGKEVIAVYGTLKSGNGNAGFLSGDDAEMLGWGFTKEHHRLCDNGLPYLIEGGVGGKCAEVEVYEVMPDLMARLDRLEGHPVHYERRQCTVVLETGEEVEAWVYFGDEAKDNGRYLECYGDSWLNPPDGTDGMVCPECECTDIETVDGYIYCPNCYHWGQATQPRKWYDGAHEAEIEAEAHNN